MDRVCETCKHWGKPDKSFAPCGEFLQGLYLYTPVLDKKPTIETYEDFGCVYWEEKE